MIHFNEEFMKTPLSILILITCQTFAQQRNDLPAGSATNKTRELLNEFDIRLKANSESEDVGSIAAAVIDGDKILWTGYYGFVDKFRKTKPSSNTLYLIGSVSKSVTGLALAKLVESGVVRLDDAVERYVPEIRDVKGLPATVSITFRQLATHSSGLGREADLAEASEGPISEWEKKLLACIPMTSFGPESYQKYSYSNIGYGILGLAMSRAAHKSFEELIRESVFDPLKMKNSTFIITPEMKTDLAVAYSGTRDYNLGRGYKFPNGGVYSTLDDMANFAKAQLHTEGLEFLNGHTWEQVQDFQIITKETADEKYGYGLGVSVWTDKIKRKWIYHNGTVAPGYSAALYCDISAGIGIVILRNDKGTDDIAGIADEYLFRLGELRK